jgi:soluble lytic murein transglycosylase-like protein
MLAKSTLVLDVFSPARLARWARNLASMLVLAASLMALALIVNNHYGPLWFGESLQRALPLETLTPSGEAAQSGRDLSPLSDAEENRYRTLAAFLAKRYRVSQDVTFDLVSLAHTVGQQLGLDPLLIIAVIAVESGFNPIAESVAGAKGLMQVIPKYHTDKLHQFGGEKAVFDPAANVVVGAQILKEYLRRTGNLGIALQMYAGALGDYEDQYTNKVMNEKRRLQQVLSQTLVRSAPAKTASARTVSY